MCRSAVLFVCICLLCSCAGTKVQPVSSGFRCQVETEINGIHIAAQLDRTDSAETVLVFSQPAEIAGMTMTCKNGQCSVQYAGFSLEIPEQFARERALVELLNERLDAACSQEMISDSTFVFDESSGLPLQLELPEQGVMIRFSHWELPDEVDRSE